VTNKEYHLINKKIKNEMVIKRTAGRQSIFQRIGEQDKINKNWHTERNTNYIEKEHHI
jgi:hypothetical protein